MRHAQVEERSAEEFILDFAGELTGGFGCHLQFFIGVVMQSDVLCDLVLRHAKARRLDCSVVLTSLRSLQTEILKVVDTLCVDELNILTGCSTIGIAQDTLHVVVVVLDRTANEVSLRAAGGRRAISRVNTKTAVPISSSATYLVQAGRQTRFLGAGVNEGIVQAANNFVWHSLERPGTHADVLRSNIQLYHVVHAVGSLWQSSWIHSLRVVLQLTERLLFGQQRINDEAEGGSLTFRLLVAPTLTLVQRKILHAVVGGADKVEVCELLERNLPMGDDDVHNDQK